MKSQVLKDTACTEEYFCQKYTSVRVVCLVK